MRSQGEGILLPKGNGQSTALPPFADDGATNLVDNFFTLPGASAPLHDVTITVKVRMGFGERFEVRSLPSVHFRQLQPDEGILDFVFETAAPGTTPTCGTATDWQEADDWIGRFGDMPNMRFTLETPGHIPSAVTLRVEKRQSDQSWSGTCHDLDGTYL